jgi:hypothetical protein
MALLGINVSPHSTLLNVLNGRLRGAKFDSNLTTGHPALFQSCFNLKDFLSVKSSGPLQCLGLFRALCFNMCSAVQKSYDRAIFYLKPSCNLFWLSAVFGHRNNAIQVFLSEFCICAVNSFFDWMEPRVKRVLNVFRTRNPFKILGSVVGFDAVDVVDFVLRGRLRLQKGRGDQPVNPHVSVFGRIGKINVKIAGWGFYIFQNAVNAAPRAASEPHGISFAADPVNAFPPWYVAPLLRHGLALKSMTTLYPPFAY